MSLSTFLKLVNKALKFTISRPLQRFNIENRAIKYLGPESKKFTPSPRAIGRIANLSLKELPRYPHLESGYKSVSHRRRVAIESDISDDSTPRFKSFSYDKGDDNLVIGASNQLDVVKTIVRLEPPQTASNRLGSHRDEDSQLKPAHRPLPTSRDLPFQDVLALWEVKEGAPPGRLNLNMLQELMLNKLADEAHWTPKMIADKYNIREDYAEKLTAYMKQIRIRLSPREAKNMELVGRNNEQYNAAKHIVFYVDKSLRTRKDRQYDAMFLPQDQLPDDVKEIIDQPGSLQVEPEQKFALRKRTFKTPQPLRIGPANVAKPLEDSSHRLPAIEGNAVGVKQLEAPKTGRKFQTEERNIN